MISEFIPFSVRVESELVWCLPIPFDMELPSGLHARDIVNKSQKAIIARYKKIKETIQKVHDDNRINEKSKDLGQ